MAKYCIRCGTAMEDEKQYCPVCSKYNPNREEAKKAAWYKAAENYPQAVISHLFLLVFLNAPCLNVPEAGVCSIFRASDFIGYSEYIWLPVHWDWFMAFLTIFPCVWLLLPCFFHFFKQLQSRFFFYTAVPAFMSICIIVMFSVLFTFFDFVITPIGFLVLFLHIAAIYCDYQVTKLIYDIHNGIEDPLSPVKISL